MNAVFKAPPASERGYLLDTSVISSLAPTSRVGHLPAGCIDWLQAHNDQLFLPCIAVGELAQSIGKLRRAGAGERADRLDVWLDRLVAGYGERILPLDAAVVRLAGRLSDEAFARGAHPGFADVAIAALAQHTRRLLLTRNLTPFEALDVPCLDPIA